LERKTKEELTSTNFFVGGSRRFSVPIVIPTSYGRERIDCPLHQELHQNSIQVDKVIVNAG
jgi:hypothetical protein